jgi:hypothetical protein
MKTSTTLILILLTLSLFGQNYIDLANAYTRVSPANNVKDSSYQVNLNTVALDLKLPLVIDKNNVAIIGLDFQQNSIQSNKKEIEKTLNFSSSLIQIGLEHKWNKRSKVLIMSLSRMNSNLKNINKKHFQQGGLILGTTKKSQTFDWKYGLYYNREFFGNMFVPLAGFNWEINKKWRLKLMIPMNFEVAYKPNLKSTIGLRFDGINSSYRTNETPLGKAAYIDKADNNLWVYGELEIAKNCWIHAKAGYSILRNYRVFEAGDEMKLKVGPINFGDQRETRVSAFDNGWSFEARFIYRLPLN